MSISRVGRLGDDEHIAEPTVGDQAKHDADAEEHDHHEPADAPAQRDGQRDGHDDQ